MISGYRPLIKCLITRGTLTDKNLKRQMPDLITDAEMAISSGANFIQIREKALSAANLMNVTRALIRTSCKRAKILVNGRLDVALASGADGIHLPEDSFRVEEVRKRVPEDFLISVSTHSSMSVDHARVNGADIAFFAPVFNSGGKSGVGLAALKRSVEVSGKMELVALGGIDASNVRDVIDAGANGFAAIRAMTDSEFLKGLGELKW